MTRGSSVAVSAAAGIVSDRMIVERKVVMASKADFTDQEWKAMQKHAAFTETILSRISAFGDLAAVAGAHHERLDGKGYPRGLTGPQIALETRIITTADIFDALTADRPYRPAMPVTKAFLAFGTWRPSASPIN